MCSATSPRRTTTSNKTGCPLIWLLLQTMYRWHNPHRTLSRSRDTWFIPITASHRYRDTRYHLFSLDLNLIAEGWLVLIEMTDSSLYGWHIFLLILCMTHVWPWYGSSLCGWDTFLLLYAMFQTHILLLLDNTPRVAAGISVTSHILLSINQQSEHNDNQHGSFVKFHLKTPCLIQIKLIYNSQMSCTNSLSLNNIKI
jgi:hypothetical protein